MQAVSFEVAWASRLLPHASLWLAMFEMHPSRGGVPDFGLDPAYEGKTFSLSHMADMGTAEKNAIENH